MTSDDLTATQLNPSLKTAVTHLLRGLIDQHKAKVIVKPMADADGFWFGGGNLAEDSRGTIWLSGRYRNYGDSRTGLNAGDRGVEMAIFASHDQGKSFQKVTRWTKRDLSQPGRQVISIEGSALHQLPNGQWEAFVSSEKDQDYPHQFSEYRKPNTGVWSIDRLTGPSPDQLKKDTLETVVENQTMPVYLHVKDPEIFDLPDGSTAMIFCSHPYTWSSSNSGLAIRGPGETDFAIKTYELVARGPGWDVAAARITDRLVLPAVGLLQDQPPVTVSFYDGAECMRPLSENPRGKHRPRGFSCEELGSAFISTGDDWNSLERLSVNEPLFIAPQGTGCSRYVSTLVTETGILATWQQSQPDKSQPLVAHFLPMEDVIRLLTEGLSQ